MGRGARLRIIGRAEDTATGVGVALKVISAAGADAAEQARFEREGQVLSNLDHPGIVRVVAFGALEVPCPDGLGRRLEVGSPYIAMEWLDGEDLQARQRRSPLSLRQSLDVGRQVAMALAAAHGAGVVHRDIKPSNIFLIGGTDTQPKSGIVGPVTMGNPERVPQTPSGRRRGSGGGAALDDSAVHRLQLGPSQIRTKLVDFGVASSSDVRLTRTGAVVRTAAYMAPEQARGDAAPDARSDIYSLGATLFELIAGQPATHVEAQLHRHPGPPRHHLRAAPLGPAARRPAPPRRARPLHALVDPRRAPATSAREVAAAIDDLLRDPNLPGLARAAGAAGRAHQLGDAPGDHAGGAPRGQGRRRRTWELDRLREHGADALPPSATIRWWHTSGCSAPTGTRGRGPWSSASPWRPGGRGSAWPRGGCGSTGRGRPGEVVDHASALAREAGPGGLLADANTADLARGRFQFKMLPRGIAMVVGLGVKRDAGAVAPFVGRDAEFIATLSAYDRCVEDTTPVIVTVSGAPGIGESRLGREFLGRLMTRPEAGDGPAGLSGAHPPRLMHTRCESYGKGQALGVAADALRSLLGLPKGASLEQTETAIFERTQGGASFIGKIVPQAGQQVPGAPPRQPAVPERHQIPAAPATRSGCR